MKIVFSVWNVPPVPEKNVQKWPKMSLLLWKIGAKYLKFETLSWNSHCGTWFGTVHTPFECLTAGMSLHVWLYTPFECFTAEMSLFVWISTTLITISPWGGRSSVMNLKASFYLVLWFSCCAHFVLYFNCFEFSYFVCVDFTHSVLLWLFTFFYDSSDSLWASDWTIWGPLKRKNYVFAEICSKIKEMTILGKFE